jgi:hypothetical protein
MFARIEETPEVFTLINTFHTSPDRQNIIIETLRRFTLDITQALPGFVGASVHASLDGLRVVNYVQWSRRPDLDAMLARDDARAHMAELGVLADKIDPVPYRVAFVKAVCPTNARE